MDAPRSEPLPRPERRGRVLVCDDSPTICQLIEQILRDEFDVVSVRNGEAALESALAQNLDLVMSDWLMPGMSGLELCSKIRAHPSLAKVPVVLITSQTDDDSRVAGLEAGADDFLPKPIRPRELLARARALVRLRISRQELEQRTAELEATNHALRDAQNALVQVEKLATLGTLVAGIAHEINNPLGFMKSGSTQLDEFAVDVEDDLAKMKPALSGHEQTLAHAHESLGEIKLIAKEIADGAQRLTRIAADLKTFASSSPHQLGEVDLAAESKRAWSMAVLQATYKPKLELVAGQWPSVTAEAHHLGQVLLNIFVNAVHALEELGERGKVRVWSTYDAEQVTLHIQDNGPGIPEENLGRIFDPFFTTKPAGKGTGLGLSVSFGLIRGMGGVIEVLSPPGEGAHFFIHLPRCRSESDYYAKRLPRPPSRSILKLVGMR